MKYLEAFGIFKNNILNTELKVGDYIHVSYQWSAYDAKVEKKGQILFTLRCEDNKLKDSGLRNAEIRYLTPEEIEDFEMRINSNKYNL
jgi:hypothetical protein